MKSILFIDGEDNMGGLANKIYVLPVVKADEFPDIDVEDNNSIDAAGITFIDAEDTWFLLECTSESGILTEDSKETEDGKLYTYKIEGVVPKNTAEKWANLKEMQQYEHLVVATDVNGEKRIVGWVDGAEKHGMTLDIKFTSGKISKDKNNFAVTFTFETYRESVPVIFDENSIPIEGVVPIS